MTGYLCTDVTDDMVTIEILAKDRFAAWQLAQPAPVRAWIARTGYDGAPGSSCLLPDLADGPARVVFVEDPDDPWCWAALASRLPAGRYRFAEPLTDDQAYWAALGWELAAYRFVRYRKSDEDAPRPVVAWPRAADRARVGRCVAGIALVRDLVNMPAADLGPEDLARTAQNVAREYGAKMRAIVGDALLDENFPLIHAVGRASTRPPRLIDLRWGDETAPRVTLVGKGVCFDSGGLDIKSAANMKMMKKDMGGAAHALALAGMIMDAALPVRLRVLIPAVDNAVSGSALRPLDIVKSRKGLTVEIGNTDAEGRLILADCLAEAGREKPELLIDLATLTGAARTALGPDLPALFTSDETLAADLLAAARAEHDPMWRLPLWKPYRAMLDSKIADINNAPDSAFGGAITAALFLKEFVPEAVPWAHLDLYAWNPAARPGRPEGGEAMGLRALYALIAKKFPS